jgi:hypothetical protein
MTQQNKFLSADIKLAKLKLHLTARDHIYLPQFAGSALRGGFGHSLSSLRSLTRTNFNPEDLFHCRLRLVC